ncbi:Transcriptional regulator GlxA family, contains an amidase domain and an AraC-type DNA-binding HTH domain [Salinihabitans flavidus]|uniref:Transcriptional regulator GlxA family, contains an amidase domain and an AraC-type DNA-binding HTH domain n=1 Tax=Salinihabitans flavidus TaxID=569882 RepID=A0A1H8PMR3_9RHOB|nr:helix-turn-helix domain-containing protein [Salinihabitans flavidus]SEO43007.1 Transcriptional regulator GlxA family, contains an amidase domain and an AraC-type DNA-binding HTH domain [Salinihabitans flavidus]
MERSSDKLDIVVVLVNEGHASTAIGPIEVFASAGGMWNEMRGVDPQPRFRVSMASIDGDPIETAHGLRIAPDRAIADVGHADLVLVSASGPLPSEWMSRHAALLPWLSQRYANGSMLAGVCSGVAFLAEAGLLDGRRATTYWGVAETFRQRYPKVDWRTDLLITEDAGLFCGGGVNAATDLSLYLVERLCGHRVAVECSKALLLDMPRLNQSGYAFLPVARPHDDAKVRQVENQISKTFDRDVTLEELAEAVNMSRRNLMRRFNEATGHQPGAYLQMVRIAAARTMLEDGAPSIKQVGRAVGYGDVVSFRRVFKRHSGMTPSAYRDRFRLRQSGT